MISYSQVDNLLEQVRDFHEQPVRYYDQLSKEAEHLRAKRPYARLCAVLRQP